MYTKRVIEHIGIGEEPSSKIKSDVRRVEPIVSYWKRIQKLGDPDCIPHLFMLGRSVSTKFLPNGFSIIRF